jgi:hypothetical protein
MSNTTRLGNTDIVNIAKQRFDKQQRSKLPSIIVNLPSAGLIYPKDHVLASGQVEMRYMTAYDEDILTNTSYMREGVIFDKLLESIVMTDVDVTEIPDIDKDALIINARIISYGAEYPVTVTNSITSTEYERIVNLSKIQPKPFTLIPDDNGEFTYEVNDIRIKFSYNNPPTETTGVTDFLKNYIREINGDRSDARIAEFIRYEFLALDSRNFRKHVVDNAPGLDYSYEFEGENGSTFIAPFRVGLDLFWF